MRFIGLVALLGSLLFANAGHAQLPAAPQPPQVVVHVERVDGRWLAWFNRPTNGLWIIQANTSTERDGWFTPPSYVDDGVRVRCLLPNTPKMFFRAKRVK
jgi:hypothetical protein